MYSLLGTYYAPTKHIFLYTMNRWNLAMAVSDSPLYRNAIRRNVGWSVMCETNEEMGDKVTQYRPQMSVNKLGMCENVCKDIKITNIYHQIYTFLFQKQFVL